MTAARNSRTNNEWMAEGFHQLHVAAAWAGVQRCLQSVKGVSLPESANRLSLALNAFLDSAWLPSSAEAAARLAGDAETKAEPSDLAALTRSLERKFRQAWAKDPSIQQLRNTRDVVARSNSVKALMVASLARNDPDSTSTDVPEAASPVLEVVAFADMPRLWTDQAVALGQLLALREQLGRLQDQAAVVGQWGDLPSRCAAVTSHLARRTRVPRLWQWLTALEFPGDRNLFLESQQVLSRCGMAMQRLQSVPRAVAELLVGNVNLSGWLTAADHALADCSSSWPPLALARLEQALRACETSLPTDFLNQTIPPLASVRDWHCHLKDAFPRVPVLDLARAVLLRGVVEALERVTLPLQVQRRAWEEVSRFAETLVDGRCLHAKVLSELKGYPDALKIVEKPETDRPYLTHAGLLLKSREGSEIFFPQPEMRVPGKQTPFVDALRDLATWLVYRGAPDNGLLQLCLDVVASLVAANTDAATWWSAALTADRARLWRLVSRAALLAETDSASGQAVTAMFNELEAEGFKLELIESVQKQGVDGRVTDRSGIVSSSPLRDLGAKFVRRAHSYGPVVRAPDGLLPQFIWLRLPFLPTGDESHALAECLIAIEPMLAELRLSDREWPGWSDVNLAVGTLALALRDGKPAPEGGLRLFEALFRRMDEVPEKLCSAYRAVAGALYHCLTGPVGMDLWPRLPFARTRIGVESEPSLDAWKDQVWELVWTPTNCRDQKLRSAEVDARAQLQTWLAGSEGQNWFHRLASAARDGDNQVRLWLRGLLEAKWCACFPALNPRTGEVSWPRQVSLSKAGGTWELTEGMTPTVQVATVERFAPEVGGMVCTLRLAAPPIGTAAEAAERLQRGTKGTQEGLAVAVRNLFWAEFDRHYLDLGIVNSDALAMPILAELTRLGSTPTTANKADACLEALRDWLGHYGIEILPRRWGFQRPLDASDLSSDESSCTVPVFSEAVPGTICAVQQFGLRGGAIAQECQIQVSVGAAPCGYEEVRALLHTTKANAAWLSRRLDEWPAVWQRGHRELEHAVVDLFLEFCGEAGQGLRRQYAEVASKFSSWLTRLLEDLCSLTVFWPQSYQDYAAGWIDVRSGNAVSGRVKRVMRPGLKYLSGGLRVPAVVEIE